MNTLAFTKRRRGANAVEFALTLPVFVMIVMGLFEYGMYFAAQAQIDHAVLMGCREGAKIDPGTGGTPHVTVASDQMEARSNFACGDCTITAEDLSLDMGMTRALELDSTPDDFAVPNRSVLCRIELEYEPLLGLVPTPDSVSSAAMQRLEWQRNP